MEPDTGGGTGASKTGASTALSGLKRSSGAAAPPSKRVALSEREKAEARWANIARLPYVNTSAAAQATYVDECAASDGKKGSVTCLWCDEKKGGKVLAIGENTGNLTRHEVGDAHKAQAKIHTTVAAQRMVGNLADYQRVLLTGAKKDELDALLLQMRALTHGLVVSHGIAPDNAENVMSPTGAVFSAVQLLAQHHVKSVGVRQTVATDVIKAYDLVVAQLRELVKGKQGSLMTDAGTLKASTKGVAVLFRSSQLPGPGVVLLSVAMPEAVDDDGDVVVYDHVKCAGDIKGVCKTIDLDLDTQVRRGSRWGEVSVVPSISPPPPLAFLRVLRR